MLGEDEAIEVESSDGHGVYPVCFVQTDEASATDPALAEVRAVALPYTAGFV